MEPEKRGVSNEVKECKVPAYTPNTQMRKEVGRIRKRFSELQYIEYDHRITTETDSEFLYLLQNSLLLELKEQKILNEMQYRHAQEQLNLQRQNHRKKPKGIASR